MSVPPTGSAPPPAAGGVPRLPGWVPAGPPTGFDPSRTTRRLRRDRRRGEQSERWSDIYVAVLGAAILLAYLLGLVQFLAQGLRDAGADGLVRPGIAVVPAADAGSALLTIALLGVAALLAGLGPVAADRAQGLWWFSLPVDRGPLLARQLRIRLAWACAVGAVAWLPLGLSTGTAGPYGYTGPPLAELAAGSASLGLEFVLLGLLAAGAQAAGLRRGFSRALGLLGVLVVLAYAVDAMARALGAARSPFSGLWPVLPAAWPAWGSWLVPAVLLPLVVVGWLLVRPQLSRIRTSDLLDAGGVSGQAGNSLALLDLRSLAGSFARGPRRTSHVRDLWSRLLPARFDGSPVGALLRAEALVLVRTGRVWGRLVTSLALLAGAVTAQGGGTAVVLCTAVAVAAILAGQAAGAAASEAARVPGLEALLPLDAGTARRAHGLLPAIVLVPWGGIAGAILGWAVAGPAAVGDWMVLVAIGAFCGIGVAGGSLRMAYRPELDWGSVLQRQVLGKAGGPLIRHAVHGMELMLIAVVPLGLAVLLAPVPGVLVAVAAGMGIAGWFAGSFRPQPL
ncbi:DUF6297 family protein [Arthrobacter sp. JSM 101049]|uniref:DUF6297 family protein n=1 Tax=Arthrobacter sp. JSM 101049 TaxID=929097 RepID=UPI003569F73A